MIRVLHLITDLDVGGAETALVRLLSRIDHARFSSSVIALEGPGKLALPLQEMGIPVSFLVRRGESRVVILSRLLRALRAARTDVLQTWLYHSDLLGTIAASALRVPALCWNIRCAELERGDHPRSLFWIIGVLARLSRIPDAIVVNSATGQHAHEAQGYRPRRWALIPNGFDVEPTGPSQEQRASFRASLTLAPDVPLVGILARWHPMKDHATFLYAAARVAAQRPATRFVMAGRGVDAANHEILHMVRAHGLERATYLLGETDRPAELLAALDVAVSSSYGEAFPNVIGEAMSFGVPVVATDAGDSSLIVGDAGTIVPCRDDSALASAILDMLQLEPVQRRDLASRARRRIVEQYSLAAVVTRYESLYADLTARNGGA